LDLAVSEDDLESVLAGGILMNLLKGYPEDSYSQIPLRTSVALHGDS
jgi:hypothetical protein